MIWHPAWHPEWLLALGHLCRQFTIYTSYTIYIIYTYIVHVLYVLCILCIICIYCALHPEWLLALKQLCGKNLVWFGLVFCIVWHGVTWYGMVKYGMEWYGMEFILWTQEPSPSCRQLQMVRSDTAILPLPYCSLAFPRQGPCHDWDLFHCSVLD